MTEKNNKGKGRFTWHATASSGGTLSLELYFPTRKKKKWSTEDQQEALASVLVDAQEFMLQKGYLLPDSHFLSPRDVAKEYGYTRQYWEKLLREGKIPYKQTAAGMITTNLWVRGYLQNREQVDEYVRNRKAVVRLIEKNGRNSGTVECPQCGGDSFRFALNTNNVNGVCDNGCGFKIYATR